MIDPRARARPRLPGEGQDDGRGVSPITPAITPPSCPTPTATISRRCSTDRKSGAVNR